MDQKKLNKLFFGSFLCLLCLFTSSTITQANNIPIADIEEIKGNFQPTPSNSAYDYYIIPPDTDFPPISYSGFSGTGQYGYIHSSNGYFSSGTVTLTKGSVVSSNLYTDDTRESAHPFFKGDPCPRVIRINAPNEPSFDLSYMKPTSLHFDRSTTFLADGGEDYLFFVNSSEPFYLDVNVRDSVQGTISFGSAVPSSISLSSGFRIMTYPIIPTTGIIQNLTVNMNSRTLITLTPHPWDFPDYIPSIAVNTSFIGDINQGNYYFVDQDTGSMTIQENKLFSTRIFNLTIIEGKYYRIYANYIFDSTIVGTTNPRTYLIGDYKYLAGNLDNEGLLVYASKTENLLLVLYSPGYSQVHYSIFFKEVSPDTVVDTEALVFYTNTSLEFDTYYTFTFNTPQMMAINWTNHFDLNFYIQGAEPEEWIYVTDENFFSPETSDLIGDGLNDIGINWRYIPAGTYAVRMYSKVLNSMIHFTKIPVQLPSNSPFLVNRNSLFAIQIPLVKNRINYVNISTSDHINQSIRYEYDWVGLRGELISGAAGDAWIGNQESTGSWIGYPSNETWIRQFLPTRDYESPILMIRPFSAMNITSPISIFDALLTVDVTIPTNQSFAEVNWGSLIGDGVFIPQNPISLSQSYSIDDSITLNRNQIFGIPLNLNAFRVYNLTIFTNGNYTNFGNLNASIQSIDIHGGNLYNLEIFGTRTSGSNNTSGWQNLLILTVSPISYLYIDIQRADTGIFENATLFIKIHQLVSDEMDFHVPTMSQYKYNETIASYEVFSDEFVAEELLASEMKKPSRAVGFELGIALFSVMLAKKLRNKRRRT